jgi:methylenetetrahydrofolate reductase (NADPH)
VNIPDLFGKGRPVFSFEFFLPKLPEDMDPFLGRVRELKALDPSFVTLTYGAGGSARNATIEMAGRIKKEVGIETVCHLTCVTHTRAEIAAILDQLKALGINHLVALRGDQPKEGGSLAPRERDFGHAADLVAFVRARGGFRMAVAGYPEAHPECRDKALDMAHLAAKVAAGGDWVITQLFFDNKDYFDFVRRARAAGIAAPIVPGIMPVTGYAQLQRFTALCGAALPADLTAALEPVKNDAEAVVRAGIEHATRQCLGLLEGGAPGIHFYTLNRSRSTAAILARLRQAS